MWLSHDTLNSSTRDCRCLSVNATGDITPKFVSDEEDIFLFNQISLCNLSKLDNHCSSPNIFASFMQSLKT